MTYPKHEFIWYTCYICYSALKQLMIRSHIGSEAFTRSGHQPFWLHAVDYREFKNNRSFNYYARQFYSSRPLQIVVAWGHNILESMKHLFAVRGRHISLSYSSNIFKESELQKWYLIITYGILQPEAATVRCGLRSQHSWVTEAPIRGQRPSQLLVANVKRFYKSQIPAPTWTDGLVAK